jgi:hypothetical protein
MSMLLQETRDPKHLNGTHFTTLMWFHMFMRMFMSTKTFKLLSPLMKTSQKKKELEDVKT